MERKILHVDVNSAFLSWTAVDMLKQGAKIDIRTIPAIIGGDEEKRKGIVLAKSIPAKKYGIQTAEPIYFAKQKCPKLQIYKSNFRVYHYYSNALYDLLHEYTDKIERFSIDECFLDITDFIPKGKTDLQIAYEIQTRVKQELGFTVNIGVAQNKVLAKMASDFEKPDKVHTLYVNEISSKMWKLPVSELLMVGKRSLPKLELLGIKTIGELAHTPKELLENQFGKFGKMIWEYANGIDHSEVISEPEEPKSIGNSSTLPQDMKELEKIEEILLALTEQTCYRLRKHQLLTHTVGVQIKNKDFKMYSHQKSLSTDTDSTKIIYETAKQILKEMFQGEPIRLIGIKVDKLTTKERQQISLFDTPRNEKQQKLDQTLDKLKEKYGYDAVTRAGKMNIDEIMDFKD
ncbi:MAG: DNA polymerase IV [Clostridia bacterium]|jgi:DNA polymerase-4|nr:DNA polymerase IV [Clostridia bacterium]MCI9413033.1 DNA polymerase IV [Clostridia bacterium]